MSQRVRPGNFVGASFAHLIAQKISLPKKGLFASHVEMGPAEVDSLQIRFADIGDAMSMSSLHWFHNSTPGFPQLRLQFGVEPDRDVLGLLADSLLAQK